MGTIRYFAYGSNMLTQRLQKRCKSARAIGPAWVNGYSLVFHKRSKDGSGKATLIKADDTTARAYGVIFSIDASEMADLDRAEGAGYACIKDFTVFTTPASPVEVITYFAPPESIDSALVPYDWYRNLAVAGARQNSLPDDYVKGLEAIATEPDPDPDRPERRAAIELLGKVERSS
ncbi:MAG: gamma-glutamylcyclotransferase family protein [Hyphomicrobium sp.]